MEAEEGGRLVFGEGVATQSRFVGWGLLAAVVALVIIALEAVGMERPVAAVEEGDGVGLGVELVSRCILSGFEFRLQEATLQLLVLALFLLPLIILLFILLPLPLILLLKLLLPLLLLFPDCERL